MPDSRLTLPLILALFCAPMPAMAALSGFYDSGAQIRLLLDSSDLGDALHQLPISSLSFQGSAADDLAHWAVESAACKLQVQLKVLPPDGPGATSYEIAQIGACE